MTDRPTASTITDTQLDQLYDRLEKLAKTIHAFPDANEAANLAHARAQRDEFIARAKRAEAAITIEPPTAATILAARHLDATEGRVQVDTIVDTATRAAIDRVLAYVTKAHNSPITPVDEPTTAAEVTALENRLRLAHQARRAKEHQLDGIRRALCDAGFMQDDDPYSHADLEDVIRQNAPDPAATEATELGKTTRVFAALHRSAETDVTRVIDLYERWVKAGPPIGVSMTGYCEWWHEHLAELHDAVRPPNDDPRRPA